MQKIYTLLLVILLGNITATYASYTIDSIGIENNKGKKVIIYKVEAKETYYSISKKYNLSYKEVMEYNDNLFLQIGVTLKIPTQMPFVGASVPSSNNNNAATVTYAIKAKDNLNMLAEKYGTTVNEIKRVNNLTSNNLQIGQILQIPNSGTITETPIAETKPLYTPPVKSAPVVTSSENTHTIKAKENLNLIAQKYGTTVEDIKAVNGLTSNNLQIGQILKIPTSSTQIAETVTTPKEEVKEKIETKSKEKAIAQKTTVKPDVAVSNEGTIEHTVMASETIYSIAKKYNSTTYQIKTNNNLTTNDLTVGQKLIIKNVKPVVETEESTEDTPTGSMKEPSLKGPASKYGISQVEEKGVAVWIVDPDLDPAKMLVLHRTAAIGTIMKITNPMTNRSTFAKVVGKFTENETTKDVIIVITKAVADAVGALDKRFACNISYGALENEQ